MSTGFLTEEWRTVKELCPEFGHPYSHDDSFPGEFGSFGRCACGERVYPNSYQRGEIREEML